jgi:GT2 family glycosyltransferase
MSITVSIVVPTYRREAMLESCLEALASQRFDASRYEIIIADDAPSAATKHVVDYFSLSCPAAVRYIAVGPNHGPAAARNAGWRAAQAEVIAFTDDDCLPDPDWLANGLEAMRGADAAAGRVVVPLPKKPTDYERDCAGLSRAEFVTANCFCRCDALDAIGGFDERFTTAWREDSDLQFTLLERGFRIVRADRAVVVHPVRPASWGVSLWQQRKAFFNSLLYKKHPRFYRERIGRKPLDYYAMVLALSAAAVAISANAFWLAVGFAATWFCLVVRFAARRMQYTSRRASHVAEMLVTSAIIPILSVYWHVRGLLHNRVLFR